MGGIRAHLGAVFRLMRKRRKPRRFLVKAFLSVLTFLAPWALLKEEFKSFWQREGCIIAAQSTRDHTGLFDALVAFKLCDQLSVHRPSKPPAPKPSTTSLPYQRSYFGGGWDQPGANCLNTRALVLKETSTVRVRMSPSGCTVLRGRWVDPYTNKVYLNAQDLDIDHLVPLSFAWQHGATRWTALKREQFAKDTRNLFAVQSSANRSKGDKGPLDWLPQNRKYQCEYTVRFSRIMRIYGLSWSPVEARRFSSLQKQICG